MSPADVERLYDAVDALRVEVHGYRAELNGRLRTLENAEASRSALEAQEHLTRGRLAMWAGAIVGAASVLTTLLLHFTKAV